jgi:hypothetical protein
MKDILHSAGRFMPGNCTQIRFSFDSDAKLYTGLELINGACKMKPILVVIAGLLIASSATLAEAKDAGSTLQKRKANNQRQEHRQEHRQELRADKRQHHRRKRSQNDYRKSHHDNHRPSQSRRYDGGRSNSHNGHHRDSNKAEYFVGGLLLGCMVSNAFNSFEYCPNHYARGHVHHYSGRPYFYASKRYGECFRVERRNRREVYFDVPRRVCY